MKFWYELLQEKYSLQLRNEWIVIVPGLDNKIFVFVLFEFIRIMSECGMCVYSIFPIFAPTRKICLGFSVIIEQCDPIALVKFIFQICTSNLLN